MKKNRIVTFYNEKMVPDYRVGYSQSPQKPRLLMEKISELGYSSYFPIFKEFKPFGKEDFELAHSKSYVDAFFNGLEPAASSNGLNWSPEFAETVRYTNASLYCAITSAVQEKQITFSPTSGFHHATPSSGRGFCSFSGQVISSIKVYLSFGWVGAYVDLDGHFGNSTEDSREFVDENFGKGFMEKAIRANINPSGRHKNYLNNLKRELSPILEEAKLGKVDYFVLCSGADSIVDDDLGGQVTIEEWLEAKSCIYEELLKLDKGNKKFPTVISLFGGYREDHYDSVLDAHLQDLLACLRIRCFSDLPYQSVYKRRGGGG